MSELKEDIGRLNKTRGVCLPELQEARRYQANNLVRSQRKAKYLRCTPSNTMHPLPKGRDAIFEACPLTDARRSSALTGMSLLVLAYILPLPASADKIN